MMTRVSKRAILRLAFLVSLILGAWLALPSNAPALAQADTAGLKAVGEVTRLTAADPRTIAVRIINAALGLLGIIFLTIIVYAGFLYMTAGGDAEKVERAKKWIRNGIIGVAIILSSWALTTFIISRLLQATGEGGGVTSVGPGTGLGGDFGGGPSTGFQVQSISPVGTTTIRNIEVRFLFTREVNPVSAATQISVVRVSDNAPVAGTTTVRGALVTFVPREACPAPNADRFCFGAETAYEARVGGSLQSADRRTISCGGFAPPCRARFVSGSSVDAVAPSVTILSPVDGQSVNASATERIIVRATDDAGVSYAEISADGRLIARASPTATSTPRAFEGGVTWDPAGLSLGPHALQSRVFDIDSNNGSSPVVNVSLRAGHCFNGRRDADETAVDCGGLGCGACSGGACTRGTDCRGGVCSGGVCVDQPIITGFTPGNGRFGTFVTMTGVNFGSSGQVHFWNGSAFAALASAPAACTGAVTWSPTQVLIAVPEGARSGPIRLTNASSSLFDATNDRNGPTLGDYAVNDVARPGLCAVLPPAAIADAEVSLRGSGFGSSQGASDRVFFNDGSDREITTYGSWSDREVRIVAPRFSPSTYAARVRAGGIDSNTVAFTLDAPIVTNPIVENIDPSSTSTGSYVTITGRNFGERPGTVRFRLLEGEGGVGFGEAPTIAQCAQAWWRDTSIVVKVPSSLGTPPLTRPAAVGRYEITVVRQEPSQPTSNAVPFVLRAGTAGPGICAIEPIAGPSGVSTTIFGENFGAAADRVTFEGPLGRLSASQMTGWSANRIQVAVPSAARTGAVKVLVGANASNGIHFQVRSCLENPALICGASRQCCANGTCAAPGERCAETPRSAQYAWQTSTGEVPVSPRVVEACDQTSASPPPPSPSPWTSRPGGTNVCLNAAVAVRFTTRIDPASVAGNFLIRKCTGTGSDPCASGTPRDIAGTPLLRNVNANSDYLYFRPPSGGWDPASTYAVTLRKRIRSLGANVEMEADASCGEGASYCFRFATGATGTTCVASRVSVTPNAFTANEIGETVSYDAVPLSGDCLALDDAIRWNWYTGRGSAPGERDDRAFLTNVTDALGVVSSSQQATALQETGSRPVPINAATAVPGQPRIVGTANLFISFVPPAVTEFAPRCNQACVNATLWARFNASMDPLRATSRQILLRRCANENCTTYDPPAPLALCDSRIRLASSTQPGGRESLNFLEIEPMDPARGCRVSHLEAGGYYRVTLKNGTDGFFSRNGLPLDISRAGAQATPEGFSWTFRVKTENGGLCTASRVDVLPLEKYESLVGARQLFSAQPVSAPDACSASGQRLISTEGFSWRVADATVARLVSGSRPGPLDTTPDLPYGCSNRCLQTGAQGQIGRIAHCGNAVAETTDTQYCRRPDGTACRVGDTNCRIKAPYNTPTNGACSLLPPGSVGGEECDLGPGNLNGAPGVLCSASCLWTGATGPSCGNGTLERGEQCDAKERVCGPGPNSGSVCASDADCGGGRCNALRDRPGCAAGCVSTGSGSGVASTCGEGTVGYGETCDDGNAVSGDGCSSVCLHEGSARVSSLCGNGIAESGESCDRRGLGGAWPANCDQRTCLQQGTAACPAVGPRDPRPTNCCGNAVTEDGEDCDGGEGCSNRCLKLGSSAAYAAPSFCGDGLPLGIGEQCEAESAGDGRVDARQLAEAVGLGTVSTDGRMSTRIEATYQTTNGFATYGIRCGRTRESDCNPGGGTVNGLTDQGCCMRRPVVTDARFPLAGQTNVCRNTLVFAEFDQLMNEASVAGNFLLAEELPGTNCPTGTQNLLNLPRASRGWRATFARIWGKIAAFFTGRAVRAEVWCVGRVSGSLQFENVRRAAATTTRMTFSMSGALRPNARYQIVFRGDADLADAEKRGARNANGTVMAGETGWTFTTGERICAANNVSIRDTHAERPFLFQSRDESHRYEAVIQSLQNGRLVPIVPVSEYRWSWSPWRSQRPEILNVVGASVTDPLSRQSTSTIQADNRNGSALVFAGIQIDRDAVNVPSTSGTTIGASQLSTVMLCQRPWPFEAPAYRGRNAARFEDRQGSPILRGMTFQNGPFFNFSALYCMDGRSTATTTDDLPPLVVHETGLTPHDISRGILRQYLLAYPSTADPRLQGDGIGIRVAANPLHLSPTEWYRSQGFAGSPEPLAVDGYDAIKDGTTIYVAAVNTADNPGSGAVSSTIYLISYNDNAQEQTQEIFRQLVSNWTFNVNLTANADNACKTPAGASIISQDRFVECTADWECAATGVRNAYCASVKAKLQRDTVRIAHFQNMTEKLERVKQRDGLYPVLPTGSFVQTLTNSRWPSWQSTLGAVLGERVPEDPINRFLTCGRCRSAAGALGKPCQDGSECATGETCSSEIGTDASYNGFDPATCWNAQRQRFLCPQLDRPASTTPVTPSRFYQYRSVDRGARYELSTELEGPSAERYVPSLIQEIKRCAGTPSASLCATDRDCPRPGGFGTCVGTGGRWVYRNMCSAGEYGSDNVCGNRVLGSGELCELEDTRTASCTTSDGRQGTKVQSCSDCRAFIDTASTVCVPTQTCGNGVIERYKCYGGSGYRYGQTCSGPGSAGDAQCQDPRDRGVVMRCESVNSHDGAEEACDDGALNGTYGRCNRTCSGIGASCGDGLLSIGETCDNGEGNGAYCDTAGGCALADSCSLDCRARAPHCGDGEIQIDGREQCDGGVERTNQALCNAGSNADRPCSNDADCGGASGSCGGGTRAACAPARRCSNELARTCSADADCGVGVCGTYQTERSRQCAPPGGAGQCTWRTWTDCRPSGSCGDGRVDAGEACDDGNSNDNDACTSVCRRNVCGDGVMNPGVEECDRGADNGASCSADYGSTCARCSTSCRMEAQSGGYCGDGVRNGGEQCDRNDVPPSVCRSLGFDYAERIRCTVAGNCVLPNPGGTPPCLRYEYDEQTISSAERARCITSPPNGGPITDVLSCGLTCGYTGCRRCSDAPSPEEMGSVTGTVFDAVYSTEPVPNARVTLYFRGVRVSEAFTNDDGAFTLSNINSHPECGGYRIVVDSYRDNPCTPLTRTAARPSCAGSPAYGIGENEARYGGYWPFESRSFSASTFRVQGIRNAFGRIYLVPRVGPDETLVVATWNGSLSRRFIDAHLLLPEGYVNPTNFPGEWRDVRYDFQGNADVSGAHPHANLFCFHPDNPETEVNEALEDLSCFDFDLAPETMKFKRGSWAASGRYSYMLWDFRGTDSIRETIGLFTSRQVSVRVVTQNNSYVVDAPASTESCTGAGGWLVFQQNALTGEITIPRVNGVSSGRYVCQTSSVPNETEPVERLFNGL